MMVPMSYSRLTRNSLLIPLICRTRQISSPPSMSANYDLIARTMRHCSPRVNSHGRAQSLRKMDNWRTSSTESSTNGGWDEERSIWFAGSVMARKMTSGCRGGSSKIARHWMFGRVALKDDGEGCKHTAYSTVDAL